MRQPPDEAALLQRRDQAVNAGFGAQIERLLHLVEGRRDAIALHAPVDEFQKIALFAGQHFRCPPVAPAVVPDAMLLPRSRSVLHLFPVICQRISRVRW
jgi:hypothetical protein